MNAQEVKPTPGGIYKKFSSIESHFAVILFFISLALMVYEVLSRYFLGFSVYWAEEIVRYLIIWSMFLGYSMIVETDGHIAISVVIDKFSDKRKHLIGQFTNLMSLFYSLFLLYAGWLLVNEALIAKNISDSRLETPMWIPYLILPIGGLLLTVKWIHKMAGKKLPFEWHKDVLTYVLVLIGIGLAVFAFTSTSPLTVMLVGMGVLLVLGMPVAFCMGLLGMLVPMVFDMVDVSTLASKQFWSINTFSLLAIPFFIIAGGIIAKTSIGVHLIELASAVLKRFRGGMGIAVMAAAMIFAAMSGSSVANAAALGMISIPMLERAGYPRNFSAGILGAGGTLAIIIPPSTILVLYGAVAGASISDLFMAGIVPGVLIGMVLCLYIYYRAVKEKFDAGDQTATLSFGEFATKFRKAIWALLMPIIVLGAIYTGITTATEAAVIASVYAIIVSMFVYRDVKLKDLMAIMKHSVELSAMIYGIVMTSALFGFIITMEQLPQRLLELVTSANIGPNLFLLLLNIIVFFLGMFLGPAAIVVMVVPIIVPIATSLGIDLVHLGILLTINMELAFLTPPVGTNLYVMSSIAKLTVADVVKGTWPFILILFISLFIITYVPQLTLLLVK